MLEFIVLIVACAVDFPNCKRFPLKYLKFSTKISLNAQTTNIENNHNQYDTSTPFLQSVLEAAESISTNKRFFFPGHSGGLHASNFNFNLNMDLPELDEIDSVHSPGVSFPIPYYINSKLISIISIYICIYI